MNSRFSGPADSPNPFVFRQTVRQFNATVDSQTREFLRDVIAGNAPKHGQNNGNGYSIQPVDRIRRQYRHRKNKTDHSLERCTGPKRWGNSNRFLEGPNAQSPKLIPLTAEQMLHIEIAAYTRKIIEALTDRNDTKSDECIAQQAEDLLELLGIEDAIDPLEHHDIFDDAA